VNHSDAEVDEEFMQMFQVVVSHVGAKMHLKLFELILKIGINFAPDDDDAFWFALIDCTDYGMTFDTPHLIGLILEQVLLQNGNSWKAVCLLCILIQDYSSVKKIVLNYVIDKTTAVKSLFSPIKDYALCCYLFELLSQLGSASLTKELFPGVKFPLDGYANDDQCCEFLKEFSTDSSISHFKSFEIDSIIRCGDSTCQLTNDWFLVIVNQNDFAAPIQFELSDIKKVKYNEASVQFIVEKAVKKSMVNVDIPDFSSVKFEFSTKKECKNVYDRLRTIAGSIVTSTPRKISVVQNFITATTYEDQAEHSDSLTIIEDPTPPKVERSISIGDPTPTVTKSLSRSSNFEETKSRLGSPIMKTTKDKNVVKRGRAVSAIVAESSKVRKEELNIQGSPSIQVPDSMDSDMNDVYKKPIAIPKVTKKVVKKTQAKPSSLRDIWDFDDDLHHGNEEAKQSNSRTMKCLPTDNSKRPGKKSQLQQRLEQSHAMDEDKSAKEIVIPESQGIDVSFSELTSPIISLCQRATSRAITQTNKEMELLEAFESKSEAKKRCKQQEDDDSYKPTQSPQKKQKVVDIEKPAENPKKGRKQRVKNPRKVQDRSPSETITRQSNKNTEVEIEPVAESTTVEKTIGVRGPILTQMFESERVQKVNGKDVLGLTTTSERNKENSNPVDKLDKSKSKEADDETAVTKSTTAIPEHTSQTTMFAQSQDFFHANALLSEAYTTTLQRQIYESITAFSTQLVSKIRIINDEINKKVMNDLTNKYETLFGELKDSFQNDVDEMCGFIQDVKGLLNLPEQQLIDYIKRKKFGRIGKE
jgi:hypothetical protein